MKELKKFRKELGWSQEKLARELGVSYQTIRRWEKGMSKPSPLAQEKIEVLIKRKK